MTPQFPSVVSRDVWTLLSQLTGKLFRIYFVKRDGTKRSLEATFSPEAHFSARPKFNPIQKNLILVNSYGQPKWIPADQVYKVVCEAQVYTTGFKDPDEKPAEADDDALAMLAGFKPDPKKKAPLPLHDYRVSFFNGTFKGSLTIRTTSESLARSKGGQIATLTGIDITRIGVKHLGESKGRGNESVRMKPVRTKGEALRDIKTLAAVA